MNAVRFPLYQVQIDGQQKITIADSFRLGEHVLSLDINGEHMTVQVG